MFQLRPKLTSNLPANSAIKGGNPFSAPVLRDLTIPKKRICASLNSIDSSMSRPRSRNRFICAGISLSRGFFARFRTRPVIRSEMSLSAELVSSRRFQNRDSSTTDWRRSGKNPAESFSSSSPRMRFRTNLGRGNERVRDMSLVDDN